MIEVAAAAGGEGAEGDCRLAGAGAGAGEGAEGEYYRSQSWAEAREKVVVAGVVEGAG